MKKSMFLLVFLQFSTVTGQMLEQTDWSGGPGEQGPAYWFGDTFWSCQFIDWSAQGSIELLPDWPVNVMPPDDFPSCKDFPDSGTLESSLAWIPMGTDWGIEWGNIEWVSNEPDCTSISFQLRTGMSPGAMGDWTDPITETGTYLGSILPDTILLLQYRAILQSTDPTATPELESVLIDGWYPGGVEEDQAGIRNSGLLCVVSNPASALNVIIHVSEPGHFELQVFDLSGRLHIDIDEDIPEAGDCSYYLDNLEEGLYLIRLTSPGYVETEKAIIL